LSTIYGLSTISGLDVDAGIVSVEPSESPSVAAPRTKTPPRGQQVVEALRSAIVAGRYQPGERLIETSLSEELGTSRGPVREALRQLENEGLVMSFPYRGAVVLGVSSSTRFSGWTGAAAAVLVAAFIIFEAPLSGMSMNPARTFGSSVFAHSGALWIYFTAPTLGMLAAAEVAVRLGAARRILCAKLHHRSAAPCIFRCGHMETAT
jgi:DNA-binding transcriptional regulator YhcF (GntR family)